MNESTQLKAFLGHFQDKQPIYFREVGRTFEAEPELFSELAIPMLDWAHRLLGPEYQEKLIDGYCDFVTDVNRSQLRYEKEKHYANKTYKEVFDATYDSREFMELYHWGVFVTTFAWKHHLELFRFFKQNFLARLATPAEAPQKIVDLGCGSGIWHLMALRQLTNWSASAVDISETSVDFCRRMTADLSWKAQVEYFCADALKWSPSEPADAGISCFLLEHLEDPAGLLLNLQRSLKPGALAFVTCAITAAEVDHIFEFKRETEPLRMAEEAGFRVLSTLSAAPEKVPANRHFLPRSFAMVLQKRKNEIW